MKRKIAYFLLSAVTLSSCLTSCGNKNKWDYSREDMSNFIEFKGYLAHLKDNKYSYTISLGENNLNSGVTKDDLILFNPTEARKEMIEEKKEYMDYHVLKNSSIQVYNFQVINNAQIKFEFETDRHSHDYSILLNKEATTFGQFVFVDRFMTSEIAGEVEEDIKKEREFINKPYEDTGEINFFFDVIKNLGVAVIGGLTEDPLSIWNGIIGILQTLSTAFGSEASIESVLHLLIETEQKINDLSDKIDRNTQQLADEIVRTQAEVQKEILEQLNGQITDFVSGTLTPLTNFNRSYADEVGKAYKAYIASKSLDVKLHVEKNADGNYVCTPLGKLDEADVNLTIHMTDFTNSTKFLKDHGEIVDSGFTDEFNKDILNAIKNEQSVPADLSEDVLSQFVQGMISEMIAKDYYSKPENEEKAQNYRDLAISLCDRLSGADGGKAILQSYVERLGLMYNFGSEIKNSVTNVCANLLFRLETNVARASQAMYYAKLSAEELKTHFLNAQTKIQEVHQSAMDLPDAYSFAVKANLTSSFIKTGYASYFTDKGNYPTFHENLYIKNLTADKDSGKVKEEDSSYDKHHIVDYVQHLKVATRLSLIRALDSEIESLTYIDYLQSKNVISAESYSAYQLLAKKECDFDNGYRFLGGDLATTALTASDSGYSVYCRDNGNPGGATYFKTGYWFKYGAQQTYDYWSGKTYTSTIIDANSGNAIGNQKIFGYARYDEDHWWWRNAEHWAFVSYPDGYLAFTLETAE